MTSWEFGEYSGCIARRCNDRLGNDPAVSVISGVARIPIEVFLVTLSLAS